MPWLQIVVFAILGGIIGGYAVPRLRQRQRRDQRHDAERPPRDHA